MVRMFIARTVQPSFVGFFTAWGLQVTTSATGALRGYRDTTFATVFNHMINTKKWQGSPPHLTHCCELLLCGQNPDVLTSSRPDRITIHACSTLFRSNCPWHVASHHGVLPNIKYQNILMGDGPYHLPTDTIQHTPKNNTSLFHGQRARMGATVHDGYSVASSHPRPQHSLAVCDRSDLMMRPEALKPRTQLTACHFCTPLRCCAPNYR